MNEDWNRDSFQPHVQTMTGTNTTRPISDLMVGKSVFPSFPLPSSVSGASVSNLSLSNLNSSNFSTISSLASNMISKHSKVSKVMKSPKPKTSTSKSSKGKAAKYVFPPKLPSRLVPRDKRRYQCPKCPYATDRRDLFTRHENIHRDEKPFHCYICGKMFNRADHVKKHFLRIHRGIEYVVKLTKRVPGMNGFPTVPESVFEKNGMDEVQSASRGSNGQPKENPHPDISDDFQNCGNKLRRKMILHNTRQIRDSSSPTVSNGSSSNDSVSNGQLTGLDLSTNQSAFHGLTSNSVADSSNPLITNPFTTNLAIRVLGSSFSPFLASKLLGFGSAGQLALGPNGLISIPQPVTGATTTSMVGSSLQSLCEAMKDTHPSLINYSPLPATTCQTSVPVVTNTPKMFSSPMPSHQVTALPKTDIASTFQVSQLINQQLPTGIPPQLSPLPLTVDRIPDSQTLNGQGGANQIAAEMIRSSFEVSNVRESKASPKMKAGMSVPSKDGMLEKLELGRELEHQAVRGEDLKVVGVRNGSSMKTDTGKELKVNKPVKEFKTKLHDESAMENVDSIKCSNSSNVVSSNVVSPNTVGKVDSKGKLIFNGHRKVTTHTLSSKQASSKSKSKDDSLPSISSGCIEFSSSLPPSRSQSSSSLSLTVPVIRIESLSPNGTTSHKSKPLLRKRKSNQVSLSNLAKSHQKSMETSEKKSDSKSKLRIEDTDYFCSDCGCSFLNYHSLYTHRYLLHRYIRSLSSRCNCCGKQLPISQSNSLENSSQQLVNNQTQLSATSSATKNTGGKCFLSKQLGINCCCTFQPVKNGEEESTDIDSEYEASSSLMSRRKQLQPRKLFVDLKDRKMRKTKAGKACNDRKMLAKRKLVKRLLPIQDSNQNFYDRPKSI